MNKIDFNNTIFVIDSTTTAYMVSIIAAGEEIRCIIENKIGVDNNETLSRLRGFVDGCISYKYLDVVKVPSPFFLKPWQYISFKRRMNDLFHEDDCTYIGPETSSIISSLSVSENKIFYLYHGLGDYIQPEYSRLHVDRVKATLKRLFVNFIGLPRLPQGGYWSNRAFSMCKVNDPDIIWLDYMRFQSEIIENSLRKIPIDCEKKNILFCPLDVGHSENGLCADTTLCDDANLNIIRRNVDTKDRVFVKFHPMVYRINSDVKKDFIEKIMSMGIEAYDIVDFLDDHIGGPLVPAEVLCRYLPINCVLSQDTSTAWNLISDPMIKKIEDFYNLAGKDRDDYFEYIEIMEKKTVMDENFVVRKD